ncbi:sensor histidine kinase [Henriciella litoralis]|uniref:sensor histidine kinase n=1 Tax=Henriciella litoralis TaxID=568102 RepID=UPI00146C4A11|nr:HWE histidine kinase domain-containing protein [Henriciella litoralis]
MPHRLKTPTAWPAETNALDFRHLVDSMITPYMVLDRNLSLVYGNDAYLRATDLELEEIVGKYVFDVFPDSPDRVAEIRREFLKTLDGEVTRLDKHYVNLQHEDGTSSVRCWHCIQTPYFNDKGEVTHIVQYAEDITRADALTRRNDVIAKELDHRVKNMFAVIQAVAALAGHATETADEFRADFSARILSMSRTYSKLSNGEWQGLSLNEIIEGELEQYGGSTSPRISFNGPSIQLGLKATQDASMIIHESATNAAKYGALKSPDGRLDIDWEIKDGELVVNWRESGLTGIKEPDRVGFGSQLTQFMPNVRETRDYRDDGLRITVWVPLSVAIRDQSG